MFVLYDIVIMKLFDMCFNVLFLLFCLDVEDIV